MNNHGKGLSISLLLHLLGFMLISFLSALDTGRKTIMIDFNIMTSSAPPRQAAPPEAKRHSAPKQKKREVVKKRPDSRNAPVPAANEQEELMQEPVQQDIIPDPTDMSTRDIHEDETDGSQTYDAVSGNAQPAPHDPESDYIHAQFDFIREAVQRNLAYPQLARRMGWAGRVTVSFIICRDGVARKIEIIKSSGYPALDRDALKTIEKSLPFPVPPVEAKVILPVVYRLN